MFWAFLLLFLTESLHIHNPAEQELNCHAPITVQHGLDLPSISRFRCRSRGRLGTELEGARSMAPPAPHSAAVPDTALGSVSTTTRPRIKGFYRSAVFWPLAGQAAGSCAADTGTRAWRGLIAAACRGGGAEAACRGTGGGKGQKETIITTKTILKEKETGEPLPRAADRCWGGSVRSRRTMEHSAQRRGREGGSCARRGPGRAAEPRLHRGHGRARAGRAGGRRGWPPGST